MIPPSKLDGARGDSGPFLVRSPATKPPTPHHHIAPITLRRRNSAMILSQITLDSVFLNAQVSNLRYDPSIRRLRIFDKPLVATHFQNLTPEALRSRFGLTVPDAFLGRYVSTLFDDASVIYGAFPDACLRGMAELRPIRDRQARIAEAAFTVETPWQGRGIGDALLSRIIESARNRGIREVHMNCLATNQRMRHLASKHSAQLHLTTGEVAATLTPSWPTPLSMAQEIAKEYQALARAVLSWPD